jgi:glycosyltransferase involved in cell wall biosynthesis
VATVHFSVVIPTYNRAALIGRAVHSALEQSDWCQEILVVDDGSSDGTQDVVRAMGGKVRLVLQEHGGPSRARNTGVREAAAEWIAFLDSDDIWYKDHLPRIADAITRTDGNAALYFSDATYVGESSSVSYWKRCGYSYDAPVTLIRPAVDLAVRGTHPMLLPFVVIRKDVYLRYGGLLEDLWAGEDTHLFIRICLHEGVCAVAGVGGAVTADEPDPANRLTIAHDTGTIRRWNGAVRMYTHLLATEKDAPPAVRREFARRLAHGYWRLARLNWGVNKRTACAALLSSLRTDVTVVPSVVRDAWLRLRKRA